MNGAAVGSRGQRRRRCRSHFLSRLLPGILILLLNLSVTLGQQLPPGPGKEPFERICSSCHGLNVATQTRRTHAGWEGTVETMRGRGATGSEADFERIVQYLTNNFGPVNSAPQSVAGDRELAYVETLGIRNPVRSGGSGRVADVFVSDGEAVEYGQALFSIEV